MMDVNLFCGFIPIRIGSIIIAVFRAITSLVFLIASCAMIFNGPYNHIEIDRDSENIQETQIIYRNFAIDQWDVAAGGILGFTIGVFITSVMQLYGIVAKKPCYMIPIMCLNFVRLVFYPLIPILVLALMVMNLSTDLSAVFVFMILLVMEYLIDLHLFLVVCSYYKELISEEDNRLIQRQTGTSSPFHNNRKFPI